MSLKNDREPAINSDEVQEVETVADTLIFNLKSGKGIAVFNGPKSGQLYIRDDVNDEEEKSKSKNTGN